MSLLEVNNLSSYCIHKDGSITNKYGKIISQHTQPKGYKVVKLVDDNGKRKMWLVHRLVAEAFIPNPENKPQVNHKDGNKQNNHVSNLEWCDQSYNMIHAFTNGLNKSIGENHVNSKLNETTVNEIRNSSVTNYKLAKIYGVSQATIYRVKNNITWKG